MEQIYSFQRDFLRELEAKVDRDRMDCSEIGEIFVINVSYSTVSTTSVNANCCSCFHFRDMNLLSTLSIAIIIPMLSMK